MQSQHSVWHGPQLQHMHPSWAPDWQHILRSAPFHQNDHAQMPWDKFLGRVGQPDTPHYVFSPSKLQLAINSHALGSLEAVALEIDHLEPGHPFYAGDQTKLCRPSSDAAPPFRTRQWWEFRRGAEVAALLEPLLQRIPAGDALWKRFLDAWLCAVAWRLRIPKTRRWLPNKACDWTVEDWPLVAGEKRFVEVEEVAGAVDYVVASRTLGMLQDGRLVLAPNFAEEGDSVHILAGCSNTAVLQRRGDGSMMFLGDCYVLGLEDVLAEDAGLSWDRILIY
ncbi:hypothetical protein B0T26DRAFT_676819 [Lasiosphaeria miniovina]|uniref:Heterokaryon incompatibility protein n=1 Tax=Lasiosphaeria miniovina TaxID=1954250 RepID=A0AA40DT01_9PEZI|nr:uncharacterized protein B0T26DRAFT_676819 [Lasiosphaeria miniovina]KAK0712341.1 hypothetical protein B0T26DRAFT_676819 [Lasiosphaeria miniovina]